MDEPIIYRFPISTSEFLDDKLESEFLDAELEDALLNDDKDRFFSLMNQYDFYGYDLDRILETESSKIAIAVLNGEASGIIDDDRLVFKDDWTPLHLACVTRSPWLINHLIQTGYCVDGLGPPCDYAPLDLTQATPLDLALEVIDSGYKYGFREIYRPWTPNCSIFELFLYVISCQKPCLEVIRLLVQNTQNKEPVRKAFLNYAKDRKLIKLAALFLAVPELFLLPSLEGGSMSSIDQLCLKLYSLAKKTDIEDGLLLLLDVFNFVGHKLIAYLRINDRKVQGIKTFSTRSRISFFLREVAHGKRGISSPDDYLLSFFKPVSQHVYPYSYYTTETETCMDSYSWNIFMIIKRKDIDIDYINRKFPSLEPHEADVFTKAIKNKLSEILPAFEDNGCGYFELKGESISSNDQSKISMLEDAFEKKNLEEKMMKLKTKNEKLKNEVFQLKQKVENHVKYEKFVMMLLSVSWTFFAICWMIKN